VGSVLRTACAVSVVGALAAGLSTAATVPAAVQDAVHGRVAGWTASPGGFVAVYLDRAGGDWCGLQGAAWRVGVVNLRSGRLSSSLRIGSAMCGNSLAWVKEGRFSDGRHQDVAFMLWTTPSIGATTYVYRIDGPRLEKLGSFPGDKVTLARGTVTTSFENAGRDPNGKLRERYRFEGGRYRLVGG
jgi:hypothetical protein